MPRSWRFYVFLVAGLVLTVGGATVTVHGSPVIGAPGYLELYDPSLSEQKLRSWNARTGVDGKYKFDALAPGRYRMLSSFEIDPNDIAPVANRFTISLAGSTVSSGTGSASLN